MNAYFANRLPSDPTRIPKLLIASQLSCGALNAEIETFLLREDGIAASLNAAYPAGFKNTSGVQCHFNATVQVISSALLNSKVCFSDTPEHTNAIFKSTAIEFSFKILLGGFFKMYLYDEGEVEEDMLKFLIDTLMQPEYMKKQQCAGETLMR